ncbi:MAG: DNA polymerase III, subunit gamma and tau [Epsilonproteobacteria bacterium]|nr:DNA polymerase III, subunit gamma and tau [Campylobacterota bacterium]|tara:strand:- start:1993 stop:3606 length:1614 start_codon:yes stop_codon:yes gene_type:complete
MGQVALNLTRKWRSKKFKEIIGQELVVKILQNSLYKNTFFPVYLFSGQRGCGKTTTARVFAAAMNCQKLSEFQNNPQKIQLPCSDCDSCVAMSHMRHPDFVEIDAASYTGVDNIRNIIDTSSFLPILSKRKVYLIDEVHMLSKAAFNAFLKILEEPPEFVVFILATTEIQKLPETIKSRCFQLFFNPVKLATVVKHLEKICEQENIVYEQDALELIARSTEGSLRDAINVLEQSRFASDKVTKTIVSSVLGYLDDQIVFQIIMAVLQENRELLIKAVDQIGQTAVSIDYLLQRCQECMYDIMMYKYQASQKYFITIPEDIVQIVDATSVTRIVQCFDELSLLDEVLAKTSKKQLLFESKLLAMTLSQHSAMNVEKKKLTTKVVDNTSRYVEQWKTFIQAITKQTDPILYSMFCESDFINFDIEQKTVQIQTLKKFIMFQDLFMEHKKSYQTILERCFGAQVILAIDFGKEMRVKKESVVQQKRTPVSSHRQTTHSVRQVAGTLDISDKEKWKLTHTLLKLFGGTVSEMGKDKHESDA